MAKSMANIGIIDSRVLYVSADARTTILLLLNCSVERIMIRIAFIILLIIGGYFSSSAIQSSFWKNFFHLSIWSFGIVCSNGEIIMK